MTIHLPPEVESSLQAAVRGGHFASVEEAMVEAAHLLLHGLNRRSKSSPVADSGLGSIGFMRDDLGPDTLVGSMRDADDELDEIVADAYRQRRESTWREFDIE